MRWSDLLKSLQLQNVGNFVNLDQQEAFHKIRLTKQAICPAMTKCVFVTNKVERCNMHINLHNAAIAKIL